MKHKLSKRAMLALAICVTCVLAFGATLAQAAVYNSNKGGDNQLTVNVANSESEYIRDTAIKLDLYRVGSAEKDEPYDTYKYEFESDFAELNKGFDQQTITSDGWQKKAAEAKEIAARDDVSRYNDEPIPVGDTITGLPDGLYLVLIPDTQNDRYAFTFEPALIALPSKVDASGAPVYTTDAGSWTNMVNAVFPYIKWTMTDLKGSLQITKNVRDFVGDDATFTYHIVGEGYENYAAIHFNAGTEGSNSTIVGGIPAGLKVTVTEVDDGAQYHVEGANSGTATIVANQTVSLDDNFVFTNVPDNPGDGAKVGHGIENHFVFENDYNGGDWRPVARDPHGVSELT